MTASETSQINRLQQTIQALEAQRTVLGDAVVQASIEALRNQIAELERSEERVAQQRKLATILFVDIVGHTKLVQDLDPEVNLEIIDGALVLLAKVVESYGGHIARFQGDGFKAIFGAPAAHESDPERAVRAGLGIITAAQNYDRKLQAERNLTGFTVRVGIDTGLAIVGGGTEAEDTIGGLVVNLAARLESAAPPGGLLISHHTYQHVMRMSWRLNWSRSGIRYRWRNWSASWRQRCRSKSGLTKQKPFTGQRWPVLTGLRQRPLLISGNLRA